MAAAVPTRHHRLCRFQRDRGPLPQSLRVSRDDHLAGIRVNGRQRLVSLVLALLVEALLVLVVLSLGWPQGEPKRSGTNLVSVDVRAAPDPSPEPEKPEFSRSSPPWQSWCWAARSQRGRS